MKIINAKKIISLLFSLILLFSSLPTSSFAASVAANVSHEHEHSESCSHEHGDDEHEHEVSGKVGKSSVEWEFDEASGRLTISGTGGVDTFTSADSQPWASFRDEIVSVYFNNAENLSIKNLAFWFDGCSSLELAEIPFTTSKLGTRAFADCSSLQDIFFYYSNEDSFEISKGAFSVSKSLKTTLWLLSDEDDAKNMLLNFDWKGENRIVKTKDAYTPDVAYGNCSLVDCYCTNCDWYYGYISAGSSGHNYYIYCTTCDAEPFWIDKEDHSYSGNTCTLCGYTKACSHSSTSKTWVTTCDWETVCDDCGTVVSSGTTHGPYVYGEWKYYSSSQHRQSYTCKHGDSGTYYSYEKHSTETVYSKYTSTQHKVSKYCATCDTTVSSSYASHSFTYGDWEHHSSTQHKRTLSCTCGYTEVEYADHVDSNNNGNCDDCDHLLTRFSVTIPASLSLAVSQKGEVYTADDAAIVNNSTGTVEVTSIKLDAQGKWSLVPYDYNMADAKVDSHLLGFSFGESVTSKSGASENLALAGEWTISESSSLPLTYDAVVSATSKAISSEEVLTATFVLDWAS